MYVRRMMVTTTLLLAALTLCFAVPAAQAGTFKRTKTMVIKYAWGTVSLDEFDEIESTYPGYLPTADVTFYPDGTFDAVDNQSGATGGGLYNKRGKKLEIMILPAGPLGFVEYVGKRVSSGVWEGEILVDGVVWGHWRGTF